MRVSFCILTTAIANAIKINLGCGDGTNTGTRWFGRLCLRRNRCVLGRSLDVGMEEENLGQRKFSA